MTRAYEAWERFWFAPQPVSTLVLVRIAFGILSFACAASLTPDLASFFGPDGLLPTAPPFSAVSWGIFNLASPMWLVILVWALMLVASVALVVGFWTRLSAFIVLLGVLSFERRMPFAFNGGDGLVRILALYVFLAPTGAAVSLDRLRRHRDDPWGFPQRAPWALRLMQLQVSLIYLSAVWEKVQGHTWPNGTALSYALRLDDIARFPLPSPFADWPAVVALLTWSTLAIEFSAGALVWIPKLRPWVLAAGVMLHLVIAYSMRVGFFSAGMMVLYLAFVSPERAAWVIDQARSRSEALRTTLVQKIPRRSRGLV
jgi:uncharacterized membrane protein YphA (DoxX/SURF4 family)